MKEKDASIKKIGISRNIPNDMEYFSQFDFKETVDISDNLPNINNIISSIVNLRVISSKLINTMEGICVEGEKLSGCKVLVEIEIDQRIMYAADNPEQSIHSIENKFFQNCYIVVPPFIEGTKAELLVKYERFKINVFIEDFVISNMDSRSIFTTIFLLAEAKYNPTYELCISQYDDNRNSQIYICYDDGRYYKSLINNVMSKNIFPAWAPNGQEIAYLSSEEDRYMLYILNINGNIPRRITDSETFECVTSFCWNNIGNNIVFSAIKDGKKDIYSIDTKKLTYEKLTYGEGAVKSYRPKFSYDGDKIAYLRSGLHANNLYVMEAHGLRLQEITNYGYVRDFDWSRDNRHIVYIIDEQLGNLSIYIADIQAFQRDIIEVPGRLFYLNKVRYSPRNKYITYIGFDGLTEDIYLYDINNEDTKNLTRNIDGIRISDYVWKIDQKKIYYSANNLGHYNVYSLDVERDTIIQITDTRSTYMKLSYRPQII